jgi:hypothetical protein
MRSRVTSNAADLFYICIFDNIAEKLIRFKSIAGLGSILVALTGNYRLSSGITDK